MDDSTNTVVRDFIYLDVERLKSILSQVDEGFLEQTDKSKTSTGTAKFGAEFQVPLLAKAGGAGEYLSSNQVSETRTLHDHIYNYVERKLREQGRLFVLHEELDAAGWLDDDKRADVNESAFVLVRGMPLINDYALLKSFMTDFNKIAAAIGRFEAGTKAQTLPKAKAKNMQAEGSSQYQLPEQTLKDLTAVLKAFVRNDLIVKIMPFPDQPNARAVTNLDIPQALRMSLESLLFRFGSAPSRPWTLFGQLAALPLYTHVPYAYNGTLGTQIDTAFQGMFNSLRSFEALIKSVTYPEIAVIPIALYRG